MNGFPSQSVVPVEDGAITMAVAVRTRAGVKETRAVDLVRPAARVRFFLPLPC